MNRLRQKSAFLFDLDGTLVDSSALHEKVFRDVLREHAPRQLELFDYDVLKGKPTAQSFRELGIAEGVTLDMLVNEKQRRYRAAVLAGELRLMPGAIETLPLLAARRKRLFVVTGGSRRSVDAALEVTGIRRFFEGVVTADDVSFGKPAPDSFLLCLRRYGIPANRAVGIEDSLNGVEACRAAGLEVALVNECGSECGAQWRFAGLAEFQQALVDEEQFAHA